MLEGLRILVASPLGHVVAPPLSAACEGGAVVVAADEDEFARAVAGRVRYDVVVADLSFISLGLVLPALARCSRPGADLSEMSAIMQRLTDAHSQRMARLGLAA